MSEDLIHELEALNAVLVRLRQEGAAACDRLTGQDTQRALSLLREARALIEGAPRPQMLVRVSPVEAFPTRLRVKVRSEPAPPPQQPLIERIAACAPAIELVAIDEAATGPCDALTSIKGIDEAMAARLNQLGVQRFSQIAAWTADDVARIKAAIDSPVVSRQAWIEQAALLAQGLDTAYLRSMRFEDETLSGSPAAPSDSRSLTLRERLAVVPEEPPPLPPSESLWGEGEQDVDADPDLAFLARLERPEVETAEAERPVDEQEVGEADVVIVHRDRDGPEGEIVVEKAPRRGPRLLRPMRSRLELPPAEDAFDAGTYSAYRADVEEASVEIIRGGPQRQSAPPHPRSREDVLALDQPTGIGRFLQVLKGEKPQSP